MLGLPAEVIVLRDFTGAFAFSSAISITEITVGSLPEPATLGIVAVVLAAFATIVAARGGTVWISIVSEGSTTAKICRGWSKVKAKNNPHPLPGSSSHAQSVLDFRVSRHS